MAPTTTQLPSIAENLKFTDDNDNDSDDSFHSAVEPEPHPKKFMIAKNVQNGKTSQVIEFMGEQFKEDSVKGNSLHIVYTMDNTNNQSQFNLRVVKDLRGKFKGKIAIVTCNANKLPDDLLTDESTIVVKSVVDLIFQKDDTAGMVDMFAKRNIKCEEEAIGVILMCTNSSKIGSSKALIDHIFEKDSSRSYIQRIFMYFDEYHKTFKSFQAKTSPQELIRSVIDYPIVHGVVTITATPKTVLKEEGDYIKLEPKLDSNPHEYIGVRDLDSHVLEYKFKAKSKKNPNRKSHDDKATQYVKFIFEENPGVLVNNTRWFIPAMSSIDSHKRVAKHVMELNNETVVVIVNGAKDHDGKPIGPVITYNQNPENPDSKNPKQIPLSGSGELNEKVATALEDNDLKGRPLVYTGKICISMGTTLTHWKIGPFTHAIVHADHSNSNDSYKKDREEDAIYQLIGRCCGRIKSERWEEWKNEPPTKIFWSEKTRIAALSAEGGSSACNDEPDGQTVSLQTFQTGHQKAKIDAVRTAQPRKTKEEEQAERKAARDAKKAMERQQKAEQKQREKDEKTERDRLEKIEKDDKIIDGLLTQSEFNRLTRNMFPRWVKVTNNTLIAQFMRAVDHDKVYAEQEFVELLKSCRNNKGKDMSKHKSHLLNIRTGTQGFGSIIKHDNNGYQLYPALCEAYKQCFIN